jgi:hypothetical protein
MAVIMKGLLVGAITASGILSPLPVASPLALEPASEESAVSEESAA